MPLGRIGRGLVSSEEVNKYIKFYDPPILNDFNTPPDFVTPDIILRRRLSAGLNLSLPAGRGRPAINLPMEVIEDPDGERTFPSETIRVRQGQVVHVEVSASGGSHTIHWHGIEPSPINDGVGNTAFELGRYTYQFRPSEAGTYIYHCHKNTPLHFELGMYGLLIVDPPEGPGRAFDGGPEYDIEAFWVVDELDPRWHFLNHNAFMVRVNDINGDPNVRDSLFEFTNNGIFNEFRAEYFVVTGVPSVNNYTPITDPRVAINAQVGQKILIRVVNAGYTLQRYSIPIDATVIAIDGHPLGKPPFGKYSSPITLKANTPFELTSARRWDLIIDAKSSGIFEAKVEHYDIIRRTFLAQQLIRITIL
jgi:FtsP/CotA-like multicopper oxidase with cupredoxin domain